MEISSSKDDLRSDSKVNFRDGISGSTVASITVNLIVLASAIVSLILSVRATNDANDVKSRLDDILKASVVSSDRIKDIELVSSGVLKNLNELNKTSNDVFIDNIKVSKQISLLITNISNISIALNSIDVRSIKESAEIQLTSIANLTEVVDKIKSSVSLSLSSLEGLERDLISINDSVRTFSDLNRTLNELVDRSIKGIETSISSVDDSIQYQVSVFNNKISIVNTTFNALEYDLRVGFSSLNTSIQELSLINETLEDLINNAINKVDDVVVELNRTLISSIHDINGRLGAVNDSFNSIDMLISEISITSLSLGNKVNKSINSLELYHNGVRTKFLLEFPCRIQQGTDQSGWDETRATANIIENVLIREGAQDVLGHWFDTPNGYTNQFTRAGYYPAYVPAIWLSIDFKRVKFQKCDSVSATDPPDRGNGRKSCLTDFTTLNYNPCQRETTIVSANMFFKIISDLSIC